MTSPPARPGPTDDDTRWTRSDRAITRWVPDGVLVLLLPDGEPDLVTGSGGLLWDLLGEPATLDQLATALARHFHHEQAAVADDLRRTLDDLAARSLVVAVP